MPETPAAVKTPSRADEIRAKNREVLAEMKKACPLLVRWTLQFGHRGVNLVDAAELTKLPPGDSQSAVARWRIRLFSRTHQYSIIARPPHGQGDRTSTTADDGYLGCTVQARMPLAGEDWTRGRDLADGPYSDATWIAIVHDILGYELVRLGK